MPRPVRYHASFRYDLSQRVKWLRANRAPEQRANLRAALAAFKDRIGTNAGVGFEVEQRGTRSFRFFPIGSRLPYVVWYYYDASDPKAPVWLAMLLHEAQDRERFNPERFG